MATFLQTIVNGLSTGCVYALLALGLTLTFGIGRIANFAHGEVMVLGGLIAATLVGTATASIGRFALAVVAGVLVCAVLGGVLERTLFRSTTPISSLVISIGLILVLQELMAELWGLSGHSIDTAIKGTVSAGEVIIPWSSIVVAATTLVALALCFAFLQRTRIGLLWRAMSQDPQAAMLLGTATTRYRLMTFVVGAALAGLAGGLLLLTTPLTPITGAGLIASAFAAVIVGGIGDPRGALVGGLLVGLGEAFTAVYWDNRYIQMVGMVVLVAVLLVRPFGIWGRDHDLAEA